jgi:hypothetical protein
MPGAFRLCSMIFALSTLRSTAERRLPGYLEAALSLGTPVGQDRYEFTSEQMAALAKYRKPFGLGDIVKSAIHAGVNALPLAEATKSKIKGCSACAKRAARLNAVIPNIGLKQD